MKLCTLPKISVVLAADAFAKTGEVLLDLQPPDWSYPFVVNVALSVELYLKSYLTEDDWMPLSVDDESVVYQGFTKCSERDHRFDKLYSKIPEQIKCQIEAEFPHCLLAQSFPSLGAVLNKYANSFVEARYPYERNGFKGGCMTDLMILSTFLKATIYKLGEFRCVVDE